MQPSMKGIFKRKITPTSTSPAQAVFGVQQNADGTTSQVSATTTGRTTTTTATTLSNDGNEGLLADPLAGTGDIYDPSGSGSGGGGPSLAALVGAGQSTSKSGLSPSRPDGRLAQRSSANHSSPGPSSGPYGFHLHSMALRIKDPDRSLPFYQQALGMEVVKHSEADDYSMYFLAFRNASQPSQGSLQRRGSAGLSGVAGAATGAAGGVDDEEAIFGARQGMLQLIHVHGSESDPAFRVFTGGPVSRPLCLSTIPADPCS